MEYPRIRLLCALFLALSIGGVALCSQSGDQGESEPLALLADLYSDAEQLVEDEQWDEATAACEEAFQAIDDLPTEDASMRWSARFLLLEATAFVHLGSRDAALEDAETALTIGEALEDPSIMARSLYLIAACFVSTGRVAEAAAPLEDAIVRSEEGGDQETRAQSTYLLGQVQAALARAEYATSDFHSAIEGAEAAVELLVASASMFDDLGHGERARAAHRYAANAWIVVGNSYEGLARPDPTQHEPAIDAYEEAILAFECAGDSEGLWKIRDHLGTLLTLIPEVDYSTALAHHREACEIAKALDDPLKLVESWIGIADCSIHLGLYDDARGAVSEGTEALSRLIGGSREALSAEALLSDLAGWIAFHTAGYMEAVAAFEAAYEVAGGLGDATRCARAEYGLAWCYQALADYERAVQAFQNVRDLIERVAEAAGGTPRELAPAYADLHNGLGICLMENGDYDEARVELAQGVRISERLFYAEAQANAYANLGVLQMRIGEYGAAISTHEIGLSLAASYDLGRLVAANHNHLGMCHTAMADSGTTDGSAYAIAEDHHRVALDLAQAGTEEHWRAAWGLGRALRGQGRYDEARASYDRAIDAVERIRSRITVDTLSHSYFASIVDLYSEYLELLYEMGERESMLWVAERARARSFLDVLSHGGVTIESGIEGISALGDVDAASIRDLIDEVPDVLTGDEAVFVYAWGTDHLFHWLVTADGGVEGPIAQDLAYGEALERIYAFRSRMEGELSSILESETVRADLGFLHSLLIEPTETLSGALGTWVFVPSGPLWYVPFSALLPSQSEGHVVERHAVAYAPSLASLPSLLSREVDESEMSSGRTLAFANPTVHGMPTLGADLIVAMEGFVDSTEGGDLYTREDATEERFAAAFPKADEASGYDIVAFICHGVFRYGNPLFSYLALCPTEVADGMLQAREILTMDLDQADLVLTAACETFLTSVESRGGDTAGIGLERSDREILDILRGLMEGDEIVGLSRSFLLAGADSVVATQWLLYVPTARRFLPMFGDGLAEGVPKAEALRQAQCQLLADDPEMRERPFEWASFVLIGDWR